MGEPDTEYTPVTARYPVLNGDLYKALLEVQAELPTLQKSAINPHFKSKYVPLEQLHEEVLPILNEHGLVWVTLPILGGNAGAEPVPGLHYRLIHAETGQSIEGMMSLVMAKQDPQGQGSAITYARRYALMAVLGLVADEDDDGNAASGRRAPARAAKTTKRAKREPEASTESRASSEQLANIAALARRLSITQASDEWKSLLADVGAEGKKVNELSEDQATWVIAKLAKQAQDKGE